MWNYGEQSYDRFVWKHEGRPKKLKEVLQEEMEFSVRLLCELKKGALVRVEGRDCPFHEVVKPDQRIEIKLTPEESEYPAEDMDLTLLYEDSDVLVVEKPPYMVVHPTKGHPEHTLLNGLLAIFRQKGIRSKVRFVNRLDRDTSGILMVAKNAYAHSVLTKKNGIHSMEKVYHAFIEGHLKKKEGEIELPIARSDDGIRRLVHESGQYALTRYRVVKTYKDAQLVEIRLKTGRTHQIRVHFSHIGSPLLGDPLYGGNGRLIQRQALHCMKLGFHSPREEGLRFVQTELPQDLKELDRRLEEGF
ncbi:MAG: RluA family pseudouridine synthase [Peptostreptococcaceae bacterium]|nr:RluA family pseudouridine synthase [Peptostreptococcaceae bacterium]